MPLTQPTTPQIPKSKVTWVQRFARILFYASIGVLIYFATTKQVQIIQVNHFDKVQHLVAFGWLTVIAYLAWHHSTMKRFAIIFSISGSIEIAQALISYRTASWEDLVANALGILLAELFARYLFPRKKNA